MEEEKVAQDVTEVKGKHVLTQEEKDYNHNKWFFCTTGIGRDMLYCLVSTYFLQYIQFGLTLTVAQFTTLYLLIGILGRIWDGINDPMMGAIIDGAHIKWGKFKPWIFYGAVLDSLLTVALFNIRPLSGTVGQGWLYIGVICFVYLLWEAAFTMNDIGYWSMIPTLSRTKKRRDQITTLTIFFAGLGTVIMTALVTYISPGNMLNAYTLFSIIACVVVIGGQSITAFCVKEPPREEAEQDPDNKVSMKDLFKTVKNNRQLLWMCLALLCSSAATDILMGLVYNLYYMEIGYDGQMIYFLIVYALANTVMQLVYPPISKKIGRKKIQTIALIIVACGYVGLGLCGWTTILPFDIITLCIFGLMVFVGGTWFYTATLVNMSNCVEYNEYTTGRRDEAGISAMRPLVVKFSAAIKYLVVTLVLVASGIYAISQSVSVLETQVSMFDKHVNDNSQVVEYVQSLTTYSEDIKKGMTTSQVDILIEDDDLMEVCQVQGKNVALIQGLYLVKYQNGVYKSVKKMNEFHNDSDVTSYIDTSSNYTYALLIRSANKEFQGNAVNNLYATQKTTEARIVLRIACTIVPVILIVLSWLIQQKKFIIDEKYFDMMLEEIAKRKTEKETSDTKEVAQE